jgi:hypothetical protein
MNIANLLNNTEIGEGVDAPTPNQIIVSRINNYLSLTREQIADHFPAELPPQAPYPIPSLAVNVPDSAQEMFDYYQTTFNSEYTNYRNYILTTPMFDRELSDLVPHRMYKYIHNAQTNRAFNHTSRSGKVYESGALINESIPLQDPEGIGLRGFNTLLTSQPYARNMAGLFIAHMHISRTTVSSRSFPPFMDDRANKFFRDWLNHYMPEVIRNNKGQNSKEIRIALTNCF